jgi:hypothetical protein
MPRLLDDSFYHREFLRLRHLEGFDMSASQHYARVLRRITVEDREVIHDLISDFLEAERCPSPGDLVVRYQQKLKDRVRPVADPNCPDCHGTGFRTVMRRGDEGAGPCPCRERPAPEATAERDSV